MTSSGGGLGASITGVDPSEKNIKTATVHRDEMGLDIDYRVGTAEDLAAAGEATWFSYAKYVLEQAQKAQPALEIKANELLPIPASAYPLPAPRPHNSRLDCARFQSTFGLVLPPWQQGVARMLMEVLG